MTEWTVVTVLVVVVGLFISICSPMIKNTRDNTKAMTELTITMRNLAEKLGNLETHNTSDHRRIWEHMDTQDTSLADHETRITILEKETEK